MGSLFAARLFFSNFFRPFLAKPHAQQVYGPGSHSIANKPNKHPHSETGATYCQTPSNQLFRILTVCAVMNSWRETPASSLVQPTSPPVAIALAPFLAPATHMAARV